MRYYFFSEKATQGYHSKTLKQSSSQSAVKCDNWTLRLLTRMKKKLTVTTQLTIFFKKGTFSLKNELLAEKRRVEPQVMVKSYMNLANTLP